MNGSRAKKIRKQIYGEMSQREDRVYEIRFKKVIRFLFPKVMGALNTDKCGTVHCIGLRAKYKQAKKAWKEGRREPCSTT